MEANSLVPLAGISRMTRYKITHGPGGPSIEPDLDYEEATEDNGWRESKEDDRRWEMNEEDRRVSE